jgi:hypothetical protein
VAACLSAVPCTARNPPDGGSGCPSPSPSACERGATREAGVSASAALRAPGSLHRLRAGGGERGDGPAGTGTHRQLQRLYCVAVNKAAPLPVGTPASARKGSAGLGLVRRGLILRRTTLSSQQRRPRMLSQRVSIACWPRECQVLTNGPAESPAAAEARQVRGRTGTCGHTDIRQFEQKCRTAQSAHAVRS